MKEWFKENKWIFVGGIVIVAAISTPLVLFIVRNHLDEDTFAALGPVGDFFGGTTVGLLTLASMLFVIASISMQRKQLDMQQDELKMQREELAKTREEFELTNKTLTKQQFESTFFNMINLHHNLLEGLHGGRQYLEQIHDNLAINYNFVVNNYWENELHSLRINDPNRFFDFLQSIFLLKKNIDRIENNKIIKLGLNSGNSPLELIKIDTFDTEDECNVLIEEFNTFNSDQLIEKYAKNRFIYQYLKNNRENSNVVLNTYIINTEDMFNNLENKQLLYFLKKVKEQTLIKPLSSIKRKAYEKMYKEKEEEIGHYYRNLYRIVKFIQDENFSNDEEDNKKEQKKYIGILRAQLSSMELLMLFYNVVYSKKGEKFKDLLEGTNFFDDHLIESKFLWANDKDELAALK
ncbi:putative phage abortive infection protein [Bacillus sp. FSL L8-0654]|uniref:putative phage abortive infection protein n=1 Tax=Bacillus sp. FSL L8-0654 TaxID=2921526 RepID=UPI003159B1EB